MNITNTKISSAAPPADIRHLPQKVLARRWEVSTRSLERWRIRGTGPRFLKLNGRVIYRLEDIEAFEAERLRESTTAIVHGEEQTTSSAPASSKGAA